MIRSLLLGSLLTVGLVIGGSVVSAQADDIRTEDVRFAAGASSATIRDSITGRESVSYRIGAQAGQTMTVRLNSSNTSVYFNVYEPGRGPGDEALAVSELTGPMVPDLNVFEGALPSSGEYIVSVYLYRNAARDGQTAEYTLDIGISALGAGAASGGGDFADGMAGGPDFYEVQLSSSGGVLNIRSQPSTGAGVVLAVPNGTVLRNMGCSTSEGRRWCQVETVAGSPATGWAAGDFLIESAGPGTATQLPGSVPQASTDALVPGTDFNATGMISCVRDADAAEQTCDFGVIREGGGTGTVTVFWPDGGSRVIFFDAGTPIGFDQSQADGDVAFTATREGDNNVVFVGQERFVIPDGVIFGG